MAFQSIREAAKRGDAAAIATILNINLNPQLIRVRVNWQEGSLQIWLKAPQVPSPNTVPLIQSWLAGWQSQVIRKVEVYGLEVDSDCL
jgi:hypothetical protein